MSDTPPVSDTPLPPDCHERTTCRLCAGDLATALELVPTPLANEFVSEPYEQDTFPLEVALCSKCSHAQLKHVVNSKRLFSEYCYLSGTSESFRKHFERYTAAAFSRIAPHVGHPKDALVVDIGANDGTGLVPYRQYGFKLVGVEPASSIAAEAALKTGIKYYPEFFTIELARRIREAHGQAHLVTANNVFAHVEDMSGFVSAVRELLHFKGLFVFEVQYAGELLDRGLWDMVYHEHQSFHCLRPLVPFLARHGLTVTDVELVPTHGGSLRVWASHTESRAHSGTHVRVDGFLAFEEAHGYNSPDAWRKLGQLLSDKKSELLGLLRTIKSRKVSIAAYGAPAKLTTLFYQLGLGPELIEYVVDDSPLKQGKYTPGMHLPVFPPSVLYEEGSPFGWPDFLLITAWNFADAIIEKHRALAEGGTHFVVPLPDLKVIP